MRQKLGLPLDRRFSVAVLEGGTARESWHDTLADGVWRGEDPLEFLLPILLRSHRAQVVVPDVIRQWLGDNISVALRHVRMGPLYAEILNALMLTDSSSSSSSSSVDSGSASHQAMTALVKRKAVDDDTCTWLKHWFDPSALTILEQQGWATGRARRWVLFFSLGL